MKIHAEFKQKNGGDPTVEWMLARTGVVTASEFDSLVSPKGKVRTGEGVETYLCKKLAETWLGGPLPAFTAFAVEQGVILEEQAVPFAELEYELEIRQVGFVSSNDGSIGCSPDGLIGFGQLPLDTAKPTPILDLPPNASGIEIKCPNLDTHIKYLLANCLPDDYVAQVQGSMYVTGCPTWHFLSYRRYMPPLHLIVERDEKYHAALEEAVDGFLERFEQAMATLIEINGGPPSPRHRGKVPFRKMLNEIGNDLNATA